MINRIAKFIKRSTPEKIKILVKEKFAQFGFSNEILSFSQAGEDRVLRFLFSDMKIELGKISYLDIGARHPTSGSNTFLFYSCGSKGVCVDADKTAIPKIQKLRPRDKILNVGISSSLEDHGYLYFMKSGGSTFDKEEAERRVSMGSAKILEVVKVPLMNINLLIKQNFETYPIFLTIDIEGLDLPVLKTMDFSKYPVPVICAETCGYSENHIRAKDKSIAEFLISKGYEIYADTYINTIFVNKKWFYSL